MYARVFATLHRRWIPFRVVGRVFLLRRGRQKADPQALFERGSAAAKAAASRYDTPEGTSVECFCIGQPHDDEEPALLLEECTQSPDLWKLPPQGGQVRLAFLGHITKGHRVEEADSCVVRLDNAEERGVPLPSLLAPMVAELIDARAQEKGALSASQPCLVSTAKLSYQRAGQKCRCRPTHLVRAKHHRGKHRAMQWAAAAGEKSSARRGSADAREETGRPTGSARWPTSARLGYSMLQTLRRYCFVTCTKCLTGSGADSPDTKAQPAPLR